MPSRVCIQVCEVRFAEEIQARQNQIEFETPEASSASTKAPPASVQTAPVTQGANTSRRLAPLQARNGLLL